MGGPVNFKLGGLYTTATPNHEAQKGCHSNASFLAIGPGNLHFMAKCFEKAEVYKL